MTGAYRLNPSQGHPPLRTGESGIQAVGRVLVLIPLRVTRLFVPAGRSTPSSSDQSLNPSQGHPPLRTFLLVLNRGYLFLVLIPLRVTRLFVPNSTDGDWWGGDTS